MRILPSACLAFILSTALSGCLHTAYSVATLPVRATSKMVDWTTTSRDEADRNYGRKMRKQRERDARDARREAKAERRAARERPRDDTPPS